MAYSFSELIKPKQTVVKVKLSCNVLKYNHNHDKNGRFCSVMMEEKLTILKMML